MSEHTHGSMNTDDHEKTFEGFTKALTWLAIACIIVLLFLSIFNT